MSDSNHDKMIDYLFKNGPSTRAEMLEAAGPDFNSRRYEFNKCYSDVQIETNEEVRPQLYYLKRQDGVKVMPKGYQKIVYGKSDPLE